ncbi:MAG: hypothetical protein IKL53_01235 [Lachnospiraceae bacterium]|nr:hypothetical protein [Lachnospiraceae bacterium]
MTITDMYDINTIIVDTEVALQIEGKEYAEKNVDTIIENVYTRILRTYQLDMHGKTIDEEGLLLGKSRSAAVMFIENMASLHARLCGYLQVARYNSYVSIRPVNINYMGLTQSSFKSVLIGAMQSNTIKHIGPAMQVLKNKFGLVSSCIEKKLILIMIICYELGFYEMVSSVAEILYLGDKVRR